MTYDQYTNIQVKDLYALYDLAYGDVLITGFGFGTLACWLASKPEVKSVTVLEISKSIYDIFLMSNKLPDKVKVIITDASTYKTDKHFDCLLLDHYEFTLSNWMFRDLKTITNNIPNHNLVWAWSLDTKYIEKYFGYTPYQLSGNLLYLQYIDFYEKYNDFKNNFLMIPTLPNFTKEKFNEYIMVHFDRIGYSIL